MTAIVSTTAERVRESGFARAWRMAGDAIEIVVPIALTATVVIGWGWVLLNPAP